MKALPTIAAEFDYSVLSAENAELAMRTAEKVRLHQQRTSAEIIDIGTDLIRVRDAIGHGHFGRWLSVEFRWTDRTARNYIRAAVQFGGKSETVSVLPPATLYLLASKSTPESIVGEVIDKLEAGEAVDPAVVETQVLAARKEAQEEKKRLAREQARGARKARLERDERQKDEREEERHQRREKAAAVADELIREYGHATVSMIFEAAKDFYISDAIGERLRAEPAEAAS
jgi:hypothetical protein